MTGGDFRIGRDAAVATITLDRPGKRNALTPDSLVQLEELAQSLRDDSETRVVVLRATGPDFSVGADLAAMRRDGTPPTTVVLRRTALQGSRLLRAIREIHQPTIALVQGIATGGAACIAAACDFRIGVDGCRVGLGEVKLGIPLMWNALPLFVQLVGPARAKRMAMTGALIDGVTLEGWGWLDELTADGDTAVAALAASYAALPPIAVQMIKRSANAYSGALDAAVMHADADQWLLATRTPDFGEAVGAFFAKRPPRFTGE